MKKTLIALAAVAATSAFAQSSVSITGEAAYAYRTNSAAGVKTSGWGFDTSEINFAATEDLGGGMKITGKMGIQDIAQAGASPIGNDMSVTLAGGFGTLMFANIQIGSGIRGLAQAGAPVNNMETEVLAAKSGGTDIAKYTSPRMGGFAFSIGQTDAVAGVGKGTSTGENSAITAGVTYSAGPLSASVDMTDYKGTTPATVLKPFIDDRYRISAAYDLGVAKVGLGIEAQDLQGGGTNKLTMFGVSAPVSKSMTVGAAFVKQDSSLTSGDKSGWTIGAQYNLSKTTSVKFNHSSWDSSEGAATSDKKTNFILSKTF